MFHFFHGEKKIINGQIYIINQQVGIQVHYLGSQNKGDFFLYPYFDDNLKTLVYFAFDTQQQKTLFSQMLKISGIGHKIAHSISNIPLQQLESIVEDMQTEALIKYPGIGPRTAKRIIIELKHQFSTLDLKKLNTKSSNIQSSLVKQLQKLGYDRDHIAEKIQLYNKPITKENNQEVIKRLIKHL